MTKVISEFKGKNWYLSNFFPAKFEYNGFTWPTSEHAYQAMKSEEHDVWELFATQVQTPNIAKRLGKSVPLREGWDTFKLVFMEQIVEAKFNQNPHLMAKLKDTSGMLLIEGNTWGDTFWGECPIGNGSNHLGKILMNLRDNT